MLRAIVLAMSTRANGMVRRPEHLSRAIELHVDGISLLVADRPPHRMAAPLAGDAHEYAQEIAPKSLDPSRGGVQGPPKS